MTVASESLSLNGKAPASAVNPSAFAEARVRHHLEGMGLGSGPTEDIIAMLRKHDAIGPGYLLSPRGAERVNAAWSGEGESVEPPTFRVGQRVRHKLDGRRMKVEPETADSGAPAFAVGDRVNIGIYNHRAVGVVKAIRGDGTILTDVPGWPHGVVTPASEARLVAGAEVEFLDRLQAELSRADPAADAVLASVLADLVPGNPSPESLVRELAHIGEFDIVVTLGRKGSIWEMVVRRPEGMGREEAVSLALGAIGHVSEHPEAVIFEESRPDGPAFATDDSGDAGPGDDHSGDKADATGKGSQAGVSVAVTAPELAAFISTLEADGYERIIIDGRCVGMRRNPEATAPDEPPTFSRRQAIKGAAHLIALMRAAREPLDWVLATGDFRKIADGPTGDMILAVAEDIARAEPKPEAVRKSRRDAAARIADERRKGETADVNRVLLSAGCTPMAEGELLGGPMPTSTPGPGFPPTKAQPVPPRSHKAIVPDTGAEIRPGCGDRVAEDIEAVKARLGMRGKDWEAGRNTTGVGWYAETLSWLRASRYEYNVRRTADTEDAAIRALDAKLRERATPQPPPTVGRLRRVLLTAEEQVAISAGRPSKAAEVLADLGLPPDTSIVGAEWRPEFHMQLATIESMAFDPVRPGQELERQLRPYGAGLR